ncbi:hypothetical protein QQS45_03655 [Alteriqipengyuania flavescens]|uniref:endonuclease III domain-containing protein n=1 Tax=Alteriqipengyuania flavescens TaxID=3053610 RepID=UPI0025B3C52A|nr:hypothetical protein [Alteriqipengyuania flavescens]WJY19992.1 hypothetical protein QQW98_03650 [Alteriqipengyuania flavescens]WJY25935.1 hypothetical protein QQS45_03655 [Alteriqipengyuania flavescens]
MDRNTAAAIKALFKLATTPEAILEVGDRDIARAMKPCGLYNNKTRSIRRFCEAFLAEHRGVVPDVCEGRMGLPGIGRKCADIVLSFTFGKDTIAVETHIHRVRKRIGLTDAKTAVGTAP